MKQDNKDKIRAAAQMFLDANREAETKVRNWFKPPEVAGDRSVNYGLLAVALLGFLFIMYRFTQR